MHQGALRRKRPWTVVAAAVAAVVHMLLVVLVAMLASSLFPNVFVFLAAGLAAAASFWMSVSTLAFEAGEAGTRRKGLISTATVLGLELLYLGVLWYVASDDCPLEGCVLSEERWAFVGQGVRKLFSPLLFLGSMTFLLLCTPSATAYSRES